jgi:hypothetical protein
MISFLFTLCLNSVTDGAYKGKERPYWWTAAMPIG